MKDAKMELEEVIMSMTIEEQKQLLRMLVERGLIQEVENELL